MNTQPEISPRYRASRDIDGFLNPETGPRDRLGQLSRAMLAHQGADVRSISNADAITQVLSPREPAKDQRFFAAVFLRLLSTVPQEIYDLDNSRRVLVTKLLGRFPEVSQALEIDNNTQGYERLHAFEAAAAAADGYLAHALAPNRSLASFEQTRQRVMRVYQNPLVVAIVVPFLPDFLSKRNIGVPLSAVHSHVVSEPRLTIPTYTDAKESLETILDDCTQYDTHYVREFFRPFFAALLDRLTTAFESSPFNQPARLSLKELGKNYPFTIPEAEVRLAFAVENEGPGMAFDVGLEIDTDDYLSLSTPSQFLDQIDSGERLEPIEFVANVATTTPTSILVACSLTWTDSDGSPRTVEDFIDLPAQPSNIPWEELKHAEPYSLEPVTKAKDLIGRSQETTLLISKLRAESVGSFCVYGQRRVGKTSVVVTLEDMPELNGITILNLETGMFIIPDARGTINNLGAIICNALIERHPKLASLTTPDFSGALAPLSGFLAAAFRLDPSLRLVVVLDEFDALPPALYRRGDISHAFFTTIRSLSARRPLGFILVGGETMAEILSTQGEMLNKFRPLRIDYLEKQSQWSDFVQLVRRPIEDWATITDEAVTMLYGMTAGNPFFTKFICTELVEEMKRRRDAFVTGAEMRRAIAVSVGHAGINNFQHFWDDGVVASSDERIDEERACRRRVMLSLGEVLRSKDRCSVENIATRASRFGLGETDVHRVLADFEKRKVLVQNNDEYSCKVRLFERWLVDEGVNALDLTLVEEESLRTKLEAEERRRVKDREISILVDTWGNYRGRQITDIRVKPWLEQFETTEEQRVVFELLKKLRFYSGGLIREKLRSGHGFVLRELAGRGVIRKAPEGRARRMTDNVLISFYGGDGKRGYMYAKMYADENNIYHGRIVAPRRLQKKIESLGDVAGVVFVDDFIGTGKTAVRSLQDYLPPLAQRLDQAQIDVFLVAISGFANAADKVSREVSPIVHRFRVSVSDPLTDADKCFGDKSAILPVPTERARAKEVIGSYGRKLFKESPFGFGNCQALVVFENTCPNNSLPILWATGSEAGWEPLFSRP